MSVDISLSGKNIEEIYGYQWDNFSKCVSPDLQFLNKDWYSTWELQYLPQIKADSQIKYISLFDDKDNMHGTFPYVEFSKLGLKILSVAGLYYPFRSILFSSKFAPDCAQAFVDTVHASHRSSVVRIGPAVEDELVNKEINLSFLARGWKCYEIDCGNTHIANLPNTAGEYYESLGKKFTKNLERRRANLEKLGQVEFTKYNDCASEVWEQVIDQCASVEKRSWLAVDEDAEMRIFENRRFWRQYLQSADASKRAAVWIITLNGEPIAFSFAIDSGECRYSFSSHYDEKYKKYGLGIIVYGRMFEDAINNGVKVVNMGSGEADYKARLGAKLDSRIVDYIYLPPTLMGRSIYAGLLARDKWRSFKNADLT